MELLALLFFNVPLDHFICDRTGGRGKVASCPEVLPPERLSDRWEHLEELVGTLSLEFLHDVTHGEVRWIRGEEMDVVGGYFAADDMHLELRTDPPDEFPHCFTHLPYKHTLAVLGNPDKVYLEIGSGVGGASVKSHGLLS